MLKFYNAVVLLHIRTHLDHPFAVYAGLHFIGAKQKDVVLC